MRVTSSEGPWPRRWLYPILGAVLAQGAPLGLLATLRLQMRRWPTWEFIKGEVLGESVTYLYLAISTTVVFVLLGYLLGRREDQLSERAVTDSLTSLANRRHFDTVLGEHLALSTRYHTPLSVMLVDVDRLKHLNDSLGHEAGDAALRHVARGLVTTCRTTDIACRIGGDEFAVVLPATGRQQAAELAERIRGSLAALPRARALGNLPVTVSIGIADLETAVDPRAESLVKAADRVLLQAKSEGRDRVRVARYPVLTPSPAAPPSLEPEASPRPPGAPTPPLGWVRG
jgi:diguanylate cyclase (GGDEF)-like protein